MTGHLTSGVMDHVEGPPNRGLCIMRSLLRVCSSLSIAVPITPVLYDTLCSIGDRFVVESGL